LKLNRIQRHTYGETGRKEHETTHFRLTEIAQSFLYNAVYGDAVGLSDTFHEFGHYCDFYLNWIYGAATPGTDYDLAEVCSTGVEMLICEYYDDMCTKFQNFYE